MSLQPLSYLGFHCPSGLLMSALFILTVRSFGSEELEGLIYPFPLSSLSHVVGLDRMSVPAAAWRPPMRPAIFRPPALGRLESLGVSYFNYPNVACHRVDVMNGESRWGQGHL